MKFWQHQTKVWYCNKKWYHVSVSTYYKYFSGFAKTAARIKDSNEAITDVAKNFAESAQNAETFYSDVQKGISDLNKEIIELNKLEKILLENSNNVIETKRRFEYGIHQIVLEIGDTVRTNTKELNKTILNRLDEIDRVILDNHIGALSNLTKTIEMEMSQVHNSIWYTTNIF